MHANEILPWPNPVVGPLLTKRRVPPTTKGGVRIARELPNVKILGICITITLLFSPSSLALEEEEREEFVLDALFFDANCLENQTCIGEEMDYLVEYFGADWCDPCESIEENTIPNYDGLIIQHHPSPVDSSFLSASKIRFEDGYRLQGLPSFVVNGKGLLSGETQASTLSDSITNLRSGTLDAFEFASIANGSLFWNSSQGSNVKIWYLGDVEHEFRNHTHHNMLVAQETVNSSQGYHILRNTSEFSSLTGIVIVLENPTQPQLFSIYEQEEEREYKEPLSPFATTLVTLGLILVLVPPIRTQIQYLRGKN